MIARSRHSERGFLISSPILVAISGNILYRPSSPRFLVPISVHMYQPLNGQLWKNVFPRSSPILQTTGSEYHFSPNSSNQGKSGCRMGTSVTTPGGMLKTFGTPSMPETIRGSKSNFVWSFGGFQPNDTANWVNAAFSGSPRMEPSDKRYPA